MVFMRSFVAYALFSLAFFVHVFAFSNSANDNLAVYWGQDSAGNQQELSYYCQDETIDVIPLAFLYVFFGTGGYPLLDLANICSVGSDNVFPGTGLINCSFMASDIKTCQSKGKIITLSLGGATGSVGFTSTSQAQSFAKQIWDLFLGGSSSDRPFGDAVLDGIDLDIEGGSPSFYGDFVNEIRSLSNGASKKYYVTAAPQCPYPDASIGEGLNSAPFDAVYVQFYNNYCGLDQPDSFNFDTWDKWARETSPNKDVKVYIGAPGSANAAGTGYVDAATLKNYVDQAQATYSSFGGVMLWDASEAYSNNRFDKAIKTAMTSTRDATQVNTTSSITPAAAAAPSPSLSVSATSKSSPSASNSTSTSASQTHSHHHPHHSHHVPHSHSRLFRP